MRDQRQDEAIGLEPVSRANQVDRAQKVLPQIREACSLISVRVYKCDGDMGYD